MSAVDTQRILSNWLYAGKNGPDPKFDSLASFNIYLASSIGLVRKENQDRVVVARYTSTENPSCSFMLVGLCDGVGGGKDGARSASDALSVIVTTLISTRNEKDWNLRFTHAIKQANNAIFADLKGDGGTTFSGVLVSAEGNIYAGHVGDSRIYEFEAGDDNSFLQLSLDDTIAAEVEKIRGRHDGLYSNYLTQFVGMGDDISPHVWAHSAANASSKKGFILTSDGAHGVGDSTIKRLLFNTLKPADFIKRLIYISAWFGGKDNATVVYIPPKIGATYADNDFIDSEPPVLNSLELQTVNGSFFLPDFIINLENISSRVESESKTKEVIDNKVDGLKKKFSKNKKQDIKEKIVAQLDILDSEDSLFSDLKSKHSNTDDK